MTDPMQYKAFISYAHTDQKVARWLHRSLEKYRVPKELDIDQRLTSDVRHRLGTFFIDRDELPAAEDLSAAVQDALSKSEFLIVICSPEAAGSLWVNEEILAFKKIRGEANIRCLIVSGEPFAARYGLPETDECFAPALRFHVGEDGTLSDVPAEPIAADMRPGRDGRKFARLKIIAGLIGVSLDKLVQRQTHRQNRQLLSLTGASLAALAVVTYLMVSAMEAREAAGEAREIAQARNASAEGLLEFMLGDLRTKLEPDGQLDVLGSVGQEVLDYYADRPASEFDDEALARRARALQLLGEIQSTRGDLVAAQNVFTQAGESTAELLARDPGDTARLFDHAQSVFWVASINWRRGDLEAAEAGLRDYLALAERLTRLEPGNPLWQQEMGYASSSLGTVFMERGQWHEAKQAFDQAYLAFSGLVRAHPERTEFQVDLGDIQSWLSSANLRIGDFDQALEHRLAQIRIYQDMLKANPDSPAARFEIVPAFMHLGRLSFLMGEASKSLTELKEAERLGRRITLRDPEHAVAAEILSKVLLHQAEAYHALHRYDEAMQALFEAEVLSDKLLSLNGQDVKWEVEIHQRSQIITARVLMAMGNGQAGLTLIENCIAALSDLGRRHPDNRNIRLQLAQSMTIAATYETARGGDKAAMDLSERTTALLGPIRGDLQPMGQALLASAYFTQGQLSQAKSIILALEETGFAHPDFEVMSKELTGNGE